MHRLEEAGRVVLPLVNDLRTLIPGPCSPRSSAFTKHPNYADGALWHAKNTQSGALTRGGLWVTLTAPTKKGSVPMADKKLIRFVGIILMVIAAIVTVVLESKFSDEKVGLAVGGPIALAGLVLWAFGAALSSFLAARNATKVEMPLDEGATRVEEHGRGTKFSAGIIAAVGFMGLALIIPLWPITLPIFSICAILSVG
jgi:hypothetical protein